MPDIDFTIDTSTGELQMHVPGIAGPACDEIYRISRRYIACIEYFADKPQEIAIRQCLAGISVDQRGT